MGSKGGKTNKNDNLLTHSAILLFGVKFDGFSIDRKKPRGPKSNLARFLAKASTEAHFARIYAFSYEGAFYSLPKPCVYLVLGKGKRPRNSKYGLARKDWDFADNVRVWEVDRDQATLCCDIESGSMDDLLLNTALVDNAATGSRADLSARADLASRADLSARADLAARADLTARHRFKS